MLLCNYVVTNALHTLCNLYHYDCFHICKDLMEGENKYANMPTKGTILFEHTSYTISSELYTTSC